MAAVRDPSYGRLLADTFSANDILHAVEAYPCPVPLPVEGDRFEMAAGGYTHCGHDLISSAPFAFQRIIGRPASPAWDSRYNRCGQRQTQWLECIRNRRYLSHILKNRKMNRAKQLIREQYDALVLL